MDFFAADQASHPENVENNEQRPLVGRNLNSRTPLSQHDKSYIRLPAQLIRWLTPRPVRIIIWFCLLATMIVNGVFLGIALSRKESWLSWLVVEVASIFLWAVVTHNVTSRGVSSDRDSAI